MIKSTKLKIILCLFIIHIMPSCSAEKYSFTIDVPPKYSIDTGFKKMKIKPFRSNRRQYGSTIMTLLKSGIAKEGYIRVVQNGEDCILKGVLNIGNVYKNSRTKRYKCTKYSNGKSYKSTCYTYYYTKKNMVKADYTLHSAKDGNVVFGDSVSFNFDETWSSGENRAAVRTISLSDEQIINRAIQAISRQVVSAVTPHKEIVSRELQEGKTDNIKLGITYLKNGRVDQAISIWDQCVSKAEPPEDKAAAYYNIGVIKESQGYYRDAFELYRKANALLPKEELYIQSMTRAETLNKEGKNLEKWTKQ